MATLVMRPEDVRLEGFSSDFRDTRHYKLTHLPTGITYECEGEFRKDEALQALALRVMAAGRETS